MIFLGYQITASRFPWQTRTSMAALSDPKTEGVGMKYGWKPTPGMGRFGGGWQYELGIHIGGSTVSLQCLVGLVTISKARKCPCCGDWMRKGQQTGHWRYHNRHGVGYKQHADCFNKQFATDAIEKEKALHRGEMDVSEYRAYLHGAERAAYELLEVPFPEVWQIEPPKFVVTKNPVPEPVATPKGDELDDCPF